MSTGTMWNTEADIGDVGNYLSVVVLRPIELASLKVL
jgi:hypothetical protein